jgi:hypothetical protein
MKKNILKISLLIITMVFISCGGKGDGDTTFGTESTGTEEDLLIITCDGLNGGESTASTPTATPALYFTSISDNDSIVSKNDTTQLHIVSYADPSNSTEKIRKVCVQVTTPSGLAYLLKGDN